jgi:hypothetical protein
VTSVTASTATSTGSGVAVTRAAAPGSPLLAVGRVAGSVGLADGVVEQALLAVAAVASAERHAPLDSEDLIWGCGTPWRTPNAVVGGIDTTGAGRRPLAGDGSASFAALASRGKLFGIVLVGEFIARSSRGAVTGVGAGAAEGLPGVAGAGVLIRYPAGGLAGLAPAC